MTDGRLRRIKRTYRTLAWCVRQAAAFEAAVAQARAQSLPPPDVERPSRR